MINCAYPVLNELVNWPLLLMRALGMLGYFNYPHDKEGCCGLHCGMGSQIRNCWSDSGLSGRLLIYQRVWVGILKT